MALVMHKQRDGKLLSGAGNLVAAMRLNLDDAEELFAQARLANQRFDYGAAAQHLESLRQVLQGLAGMMVETTGDLCTIQKGSD